MVGSLFLFFKGTIVEVSSKVVWAVLVYVKMFKYGFHWITFRTNEFHWNSISIFFINIDTRIQNGKNVYHLKSCKILNCKIYLDYYLMCIESIVTHLIVSYRTEKSVDIIFGLIWALDKNN
jgi:hypothetical protein